MNKHEIGEIELEAYFEGIAPERWNGKSTQPTSFYKKEVKKLTSKELKEQYEMLDALKKTLDAIKAQQELEEFNELCSNKK